MSYVVGKAKELDCECQHSLFSVLGKCVFTYFIYFVLKEHLFTYFIMFVSI